MDLSVFLSISVFLIFILICLFIILYRKILTYLDEMVDKIRYFICKNDSFFSIIFLLIFFLEQLILIILVFYFKVNIDLLQLIISIFALIVVTTSSFQKLILDIRVRHFKEQIIGFSKLFFQSQKMLGNFKELIKHLKEEDSKEK